MFFTFCLGKKVNENPTTKTKYKFFSSPMPRPAKDEKPVFRTFRGHQPHELLPFYKKQLTDFNSCFEVIKVISPQSALQGLHLVVVLARCICLGVV